MNSFAGLNDDSTPRAREQLLREATEVLLNELAILDERRWSELPDLKRRKVLLASRLRTLPADAREEALPDKLLTLLCGLEAQARRQMDLVVGRTGREIVALQEVRQFCLECASVSFRKFC
jgi:hypothetical protein